MNVFPKSHPEKHGAEKINLLTQQTANCAHPALYFRCIHYLCDPFSPENHSQ